MSKPSSDLEISMFLAMRQLLGHGYVPEYYEQAAQDFIAIARDFGAREKVQEDEV